MAPRRYHRSIEICSLVSGSSASFSMTPVFTGGAGAAGGAFGLGVAFGAGAAGGGAFGSEALGSAAFGAGGGASGVAAGAGAASAGFGAFIQGARFHPAIASRALVRSYSS